MNHQFGVTSAGLQRQEERLDSIKDDTAFTRGYLDAAHKDIRMGQEGTRDQLARLHEKVSVLLEHDCNDKHQRLLDLIQEKEKIISVLNAELSFEKTLVQEWTHQFESL